MGIVLKRIILIYIFPIIFSVILHNCQCLHHAYKNYLILNQKFKKILLPSTVVNVLKHDKFILNYVIF